ncbi:MAG: M15 family metallopeptidase [Bacteroidales bacterium]|nr:M15 family metallopeptidase [Bacteroidales bacterium]MDD3989606.1 M15 family metallopeptidase [Bacteroidales bacterium]MDD4638843.1 M15 family metallopeptidase [Bacteroidales bacterium]
MKSGKLFLSVRTLLAALLIISSISFQSCKTTRVEKNNPYSLELISTIKDYTKSVSSDSSNLLVDLERYIPGIVLDIRYADTNNFTGRKIYTLPKAYLRKPVADSLLKIQKILSGMNLGLKVFDAYRPYAATLYFYEIYKDTNFVAAPWRGSIHNRGCAVDVTLVNLVTKEELMMPTTFDDFSPAASQSYPESDSIKLANRLLLLKVMNENGFEKYEPEWWHYNFNTTERFGLMDITFEDLEKNAN